jgi:predicted DNA-binding protein
MAKDSSITLRMSEQLKEALQQLAARDRRTLSSYIEVLLEKHVEQVLWNQHPVQASAIMTVGEGQERRYARKRKPKQKG